MLTWKQMDGVWYCYKNGAIIKGWVQDQDSKWYYLNETSGKLDTGWIQINSYWYYLYPKQTTNYGITYPIGAMAVDWVEIDSCWYYLYPKQTTNYGITYPMGAMALDWVQLNSKWYYLYPNKTVNYGITYPMGAMALDWVQLNSKWYYFLKENTTYNGYTHSKGEAVMDATITINNKSYTFDANGVMQESNGLISDNLVQFIAGWEVFHSHAYEDPYYPGVQAKWTIGYGTTYEANSSAFPNGLSSKCAESQALTWLKEEINKVAKTIKSALDAQGASLSQQAFDCLCDIGYNAGTGALLNGSKTTFNAVISGDADRITTTLMSWNKANGKVSEGLTKRCKARVNMCLYGIYDSTH